MKFKWKGIKADSIEDAAGKIIGIMEDMHQENVFFFGGWQCGMGASAALNVVAQRLKSGGPGQSKFGKVILVDWMEGKSMRAVQRAVAEELELPRRVMAILDQRDEEDDFDGLDEGSRGVVAEVSGEIMINSLTGGNVFTVIFHNGSNGKYFDLSECGIPTYARVRDHKLLWTFRGSSWVPRLKEGINEGKHHDEAVKSIVGNTDFVILAVPSHEDDHEAWWGIVHQLAKEIAKSIPTADHTLVEECILYMWALRDKGITIDWATHASNYWVCDGIIQGEGGNGDDILEIPASAWEVGDALQRLYIPLDFDREHIDLVVPFASTHLREHGHEPRQAPTCSNKSTEVVPPEATSFFLVAASQVPASMFQHSGSSKLHVLHLSRCSFSFTSPPFWCCSNLRFLLLDHCEDNHHGPPHKSVADHQRVCFPKLWVLDLTSTDWCSLLSQETVGMMADLRELNVKGNIRNWSISDLRGRTLPNLVKLRVAVEPTDHDNTDNEAEHVSTNGETVEPADHDDTNNEAEQVSTNVEAVEPADHDDTDNEAEQVSTNGETANPMNHGDTDNEAAQESTNGEAVEPADHDSADNEAAQVSTNNQMLSSVSFRGCAQLKSIMLRGQRLLTSIQELDMSGTTVKTLDLSHVDMRSLRQLILLGCEKLRAILWPPNRDQRPLQLEVLLVDTTPGSASSNSIPQRGRFQVHTKKEESFNKWRIYVTDARLLRSLSPIQDYLSEAILHINIYSAANVGGWDTDEQGQIQPYASIYMVDSSSMLKEALMKMAEPTDRMMMWDCPEIPLPSGDDSLRPSCFIKLMMGLGSSKQFERAQANSPDFICNKATSLRVYDSSYITSIPAPPQGSTWFFLEWCRVERCPNLETVFTAPHKEFDIDSDDSITMFPWLETLWASQLLRARHIWSWSNAVYQAQPARRSFERLRFLHLDSCPRLIHVLPLTEDVATLPSLETLQIVCCGDLTDVFPLDHHQQQQQQEVVEFPKLRHIHLHELPRLQRICGRIMSAPSLQTVRIRGCCSHTRLPSLGDHAKKPPPTVDCEKDWWDSLQWDGDGHDPSHYRPSHSHYYKKTMAKGSLLR